MFQCWHFRNLLRWKPLIGSSCKPSEKKWLDLLHLNWWDSPRSLGGVSLTALSFVVASRIRPTRIPRRLRRSAVVKAEVLPAQPVPEGIEAPPYVADPDQVAHISVGITPGWGLESQTHEDLNVFEDYIIWMFPKIVGFSPQIIQFNRVFHYKPSILGYPYFWKHPYLVRNIELNPLWLSRFCCRPWDFTVWQTCIDLLYIHSWNPKQPFINGCLVKQPFSI